MVHIFLLKRFQTELLIADWTLLHLSSLVRASLFSFKQIVISLPCLFFVSETWEYKYKVYYMKINRTITVCGKNWSECFIWETYNPFVYFFFQDVFELLLKPLVLEWNVTTIIFDLNQVLSLTCFFLCFFIKRKKVLTNSKHGEQCSSWPVHWYVLERTDLASSQRHLVWPDQQQWTEGRQLPGLLWPLVPHPGCPCGHLA